MQASYRPGVGIMLINSDKKVFLGKRISNFALDYPWQMPQGGIDNGEDILTAARRELFEETSIISAELLFVTPNWLYYDIPYKIAQNMWQGKYKGQKQKWLLMRMAGSDEEININTPNPEFNDWKWEDINNLESVIVPFKLKLYQDVVNAFKPNIEALK